MARLWCRHHEAGDGGRQRIAAGAPELVDRGAATAAVWGHTQGANDGPSLARGHTAVAEPSWGWLALANAGCADGRLVWPVSQSRCKSLSLACLPLRSGLIGLPFSASATQASSGGHGRCRRL